jgi:hypothetical protein
MLVMRTGYKLTVLLAAVIAFHTNSSGCCTSSAFEYSSTEVQIGNQTGKIITVCDLRCENPDDPLKYYTDTLFKSTLLASLRQKFNASGLAVVAKVKSAKVFFQKPDSSNQYVHDAESVTVTFDKILKGDIQQREWTFINGRVGELFLLGCDEANGQCTVQASIQTLAIEESYLSSVGRRFIAFFDNNNVEGKFKSSMTVPDVCDKYSYSYQVDKDNNIHYDGYELDTINGKVLSIPDISITVDELVKNELLPNPSSIKQQMIPTIQLRDNTIHPSGTIYNLLGKQVQSSQLLQVKNKSTTVQIHTDTHGDKAIKHIQLE